MQQRVAYLDYVRALACILVVIIHAPVSDGSAESSIWLSLYNYAAAPCIGLFFMTSGALLFPVKDTLFVFLKKRANRIIFPLIFWSVFYLVIKLIAGEITPDKVPLIIFRALYSSSIEGVLWFLYALIGLYLFIPIISKWIETATKKELQYFLLLWSITLLLPYLKIESSILLNFGGYLGYLVLGYYLRKFPLKIGYLSMILITVLISGIFPTLIYTKILPPLVENRELYGYLTLNVAWLCVLYYTIIQRFNCIENKFVRDFSIMSFGIYLIHIFVMRYFVWEWIVGSYRLPIAIEIPVTALITLIISYTIIKFISITKISKYIIG